MIVKVKTHPKSNSWRYFSADEVQCHTDKRKKIEKLVISEDVTRFEFHFPGDPDADPMGALISFINDKDEPVEILTSLPAFLVNNTGQTVDRLF